MQNIYLSKCVISNKDIDSKSLFMYICFRNIMAKHKDIYFTSKDILVYELLNSYTNASRKLDSDFTSGIDGLITTGMIKKVKNINNVDFIINLSKLHINDGEYYITVTSDEVGKIILSKTNSKFDLLRYYLCLIGTFNNSKNVEEKYRGKIGGMTIEYFSEELGIAKSTIIRYNKTLEDLKLIHIIRYNELTYNKTNDEFKDLPNSYSRYCDMELHEEYAKGKSESYSSIDYSEKDRLKKFKQSVSKRYNNYLRNKELLDNDSVYVKALITDCIKYNNDIDIANKNGRATLEMKKKDMSVFPMEYRLVQ